MQNVVDGTVFVAVALADFHHYNFLYSCFAAAALELGADDIGSTALQPSPRHVALRCWLGLARNAGECSASPQAATEIINLFGPVGERDRMIAAAERRLAARQVKFTAAQRLDLQGFQSSVVFFSGPAGNGKTQRIIALASHVLAEHAVSPDSVLCIYATPTKKMAEEFGCQLVEAMGSSEGIVPLGVDETGSRDRFEEHIREEARDLLKHERACVSAVDFTLNLLLRYRGHTWPDWNTLFLENALCCLLAMRHEFFDQVYYKAMYAAQIRRIASVRCVICTCRMLQKFCAGIASHAAAIRRDRKLIGFIDEVQYLPEQEVSGCLALLDSCFLFGDEQQHEKEIDNRAQERPRDAPIILTENPAQSSVMSWKSACAWARRCPTVQKIDAAETLRLGWSMVKTLQFIYPGTFDHVYTSKVADTLFLPILFEKSSHWVASNTLGEAEHDQAYFAHVLFVAAVEVVLAVHHNNQTPMRTVVMNSFLNRPLAYLELFLQEKLENTCWQLHSVFGLPRPSAHMYSYHALKGEGRLSLLGPTKVAGFSGPVGITLCGPRRLKDMSWRGMCLQRSKVYVALSRASERLHLLVVDLRKEVQIPCNGPLKQQGLDLGLSLSQIVDGQQVESTSNSVVRNQYSWVRACNHAEYVWRKWLNVPKDKQYIVPPARGMLPPTMFSEVMWQGIALESETARLIAMSPRRADGLQAVLDHAYIAYSGHGYRLGCAAYDRAERIY
mgnify:FL=1